MTWWHKAACRGVPIEVFYPEGKGASLKQAREICGRCPVSTECFNDMIEHEPRDARHGFWGNTSRDDRLGKKKEPKPKPLCPHGKPLGAAGGYCQPCYEDKIEDYLGRGECLHGHRLTPENIVPSAQGYPQCRQCRRDRSREWRERQKAS